LSQPHGPIKDQALILRTIRHGETSRVATLFCAELGKVAVMAKGARSGKPGATGGALDAPCLAEVVIHFKSSRSVQILGQIMPVTAFPSIKDDVTLTAYAAVISELVYRGFTDSENNRPAFNAAVSALRTLDSNISDPRVTLWEFLLALAEALGFGLDPFTCPECGARPADLGVRNLLLFDAGAIICRNCGRTEGEAVALSGETVSIMRLAARGGARSGRLKYSSQARSELTGALLKHLRRHHPGYQSLQSLEMLERLATD